MTTTPAGAGYRATPWPNNIGFDVTAGRHTYEVWPHGAVSRLKKDTTPTGSSRVCWQKLDRSITTADEAKAAVAECITAGDWRPCE